MTTDLVSLVGQPAILMIVAAALGVGGREWVARARSGTNRIKADDDAHVSVLADVRAEKVSAVLREAVLLRQIEDLTKKLAEAEKRLTVVSMLSAADPASQVSVTLDSAFLDLDRPFRPRPKPRAPAPPTDLFQATQPFAPPTRRRLDNPPLRIDEPFRLQDLDEYFVPGKPTK